jgi:hypothetical protein
MARSSTVWSEPTLGETFEVGHLGVVVHGHVNFTDVEFI